MNLRNLALCVALLAALSVGVAARAAPATVAPAEPAEVEVQLGLGGAYKLGAWTPVRITLRGAAAAAARGQNLRLLAPDGDGVLVAYGTPIPLAAADPSGSATEVACTIYARFGRPPTQLELSLEETAQANWSHVVEASRLPRPLRSDRPLLLTLGEPLGVEQAALQRHELESQREFVATVRQAHELPADGMGYAAVDTLILATSSLELTSQLSAAQLAALDHWLRMGGRVILSLDASRPESFAPFAAWLPGPSGGTVVLRDANTLEAYVQSQSPLQVAGGPRFSLPLAAFERPAGSLLLDEIVDGQRRPLVARYAYGFGAVTLVTFNLNHAALADWPDRPRLLARLLGEVERGAGLSGEERRATLFAQLGYTDMAGQLRTALEQFPQVRAISLGIVAAVLAIYLALIGPLDYFLLRRLGRRMELTWVTFPLLVAAFSGAAWLVAARTKGSELRTNQVDLVDIDAAGGFVRGSTWLHVYSPRSQSFDLDLEPLLPGSISTPSGSLPAGAILAWEGLPGAGIGGMDSGNALLQAELPYEQSPFLGQASWHSGLRNMPLRTWSSKSLRGQWWGPAPAAASSLVADDYGVSGKIANPLPCALQAPLLVYRGLYYRLPADLPAGGEAVVGEALQPRDLAGLLTRRRVVDSKEGKEENVAWDVESADVARIFEIMMFHRAAGGEAYTGLAQRYQATLDFSELPYLGRAVLVGRLPQEAASVRQAGLPLREKSDGGWAFARVVFPVATAGK